MAKHNEIGRFGESKSVEFLLLKGYKIRHKNWNHQRLEVDIIAEIAGFIVFVEVKTRSKDLFLSASDLINEQKQLRLIAVADHYMQSVAGDFECRFDIILIIDSKITHHINAFEPTL